MQRGGSLFKELRERAGLTLQDCAEITHYTNLSRMERGVLGIGRVTAERMAELFPDYDWTAFLQYVPEERRTK